MCVLLREDTVSVSNSMKSIVPHRLPDTLWIRNLETQVLATVLSVSCSVTLSKSPRLLVT